MVGREARGLVVLTATLVVTAAVLALPMWWRLRWVGVEALSFSLVLTLLPGVFMAWLAPSIDGRDRVVKLLLVGTALRIGLVLLLALALAAWRPGLRSVEFFLCLSVMYLVALAVETRQLLSLALPGEADPSASDRHEPVLMQGSGTKSGY